MCLCGFIYVRACVQLFDRTRSRTRACACVVACMKVLGLDWIGLDWIGLG